MKLIYTTLFIFACCISCKHEPFIKNLPPIETNIIACNPDSVYFNASILPLIAASCAKSGCHDQDSHAEGLHLYNYEGIMSIVEKGKPNNSDLYKVINETNQDDIMPPPPSIPMSDAQKALIFKWIQQGAANNFCNECDTNNVSYASQLIPILQDACYTCHTGNNPSGGVLLNSYQNLKDYVDNGKLLASIQRTNKPMPPAIALPACSVNKIKAWINAGALNN